MRTVFVVAHKSTVQGVVAACHLTIRVLLIVGADNAPPARRVRHFDQETILGQPTDDIVIRI